MACFVSPGDERRNGRNHRSKTLEAPRGARTAAVGRRAERVARGRRLAVAGGTVGAHLVGTRGQDAKAVVSAGVGGGLELVGVDGTVAVVVEPVPVVVAAILVVGSDPNSRYLSGCFGWVCLFPIVVCALLHRTMTRRDGMRVYFSTFGEDSGPTLAHPARGTFDG